MVVLNIQGLVPTTGASKASFKIEYLKDLVSDNAGFIPIVSITESWCKSYHSDAQMALPNYNIYRADRQVRHRGGCAVYVHENIIVQDFKSFDNEYCEMVSIQLPESKTILNTVYRPTHCPHAKFNDLLNWIKSMLDAVDDSWTCIINGDLNFPDINWDTFSLSSPDSCGDEFLDLFTSYGLTQSVLIPTRTDKSTGASNILDLFITNDPELVLDVSCEEDPLLSDHKIVRISLSDDFKPSKTHHSNAAYSSFGIFDFNHADFERLNSYFENVNWSELSQKSEADFLSNFKDVVFNICHLCVPYKLSTVVRKPKTKLKCIQGLKRKKKKMIGRIKALQAINPASSFIPALSNKVEVINTSIKQTILNFNEKCEMDAVKKIKKNPSYFYSYVKKKSKKRSKVGPLKNCNGSIISSPSKMADLLQKQFCSVFSDVANPLKKDPDYVAAPCSLTDLDFNQADIEWAIDQIKMTSAPGEDEFPAVLLKSCKSHLALPIYLLWKKSFNDGVIDQCFLSQIIAPVFKNGSRFDPSNYRPISLTSHLIKIFERVVQKNVVAYLEENNLLNINQHGFRKGYSCLSELLAHFNDIIDNMSNGNRTDTIYLDFSKAFDKVDHELLLMKIHLFGIQGKLFNWIKAFLCNRTQKVAVEGCYSVIEPVLSGVPQGTVLGPLLFLIFINDMSKVIKHSTLRLFADDARLLKSVDNTYDSLQLQEDLSSVLQWSINNNMMLHQKKFEFICHEPYLNSSTVRLLSELPFAFSSLHGCYKADETNIYPSDLVKDLGISVTADYNFNAHINQICNKAGTKVSWILSAFKCRNSVVLLTLYTSLVRSLIEYCCPLWSPCTVNEIQKLEAVQRRLTSKITGLQDMDYWSRLKALNLMSLQRRRERYILVYMWKIHQHLVPNDVNITWTYNNRLGLKAALPRIPAKRIKLNVYDGFFKVLGCKLWNTLPKWVNTESTSLLTFKNCLNKHLLQIPDHPPVKGYVSANRNSLLDY